MVGIILSVEVNSLFAVSLLTIAGYSVNDTVVIFDRIRENLKSKKEGYNETIQLSVNESFRRTTLPVLQPLSFIKHNFVWILFAILVFLSLIIRNYSWKLFKYFIGSIFVA